MMRVMALLLLSLMAGCSPCKPDCTGKECGDDGCGGSCRKCSEGAVCAPDNKCCVTACSYNGFDCGPDFCGGSCGDCTQPAVCDLLWQRCCTPVCDGTSCADGCGGECPGACGTTEYCHNGQCVAYGKKFPGPCAIHEEPGIRSYYYTYDSEGRMLDEIFDNGSDGSPDRIYSLRYYPDGKRSREEIDYEADGVIDHLTEYNYDDQGRLETVSELMPSGNHKLTTLVYDGGLLAREDVDFLADGIVDEYYSFSHYPDGKVSTIQLIDSETGACELLQKYTYWSTADGYFEKEFVGNCNEERGSYDLYEYDSERRLFKESGWSVPDDGSFYAIIYEYDDFGFLAKEMDYSLRTGESVADSKWHDAYDYRNDEWGNVLDKKDYDAYPDHYDAVTLWSISNYTYECFR